VNIDELLEQARTASEAMTQQDRLIQALDFAYGQVACSGGLPARAVFWRLAADRQVDRARFVEWALAKKWSDVDEDGCALGPMRRWRGHTWVGWLNLVVLRWCFVHLYYVVEYDNTISRWGLATAWPWKW
jgi:hypothetical protein